MTAMVVMTIGALIATLTFNLIVGWDLGATCPGSKTFCDGVYWTTVADNLPTWLIVAQVAVLLSLASPFVLRGR